jgi:hypothetical protein
VKNCGLAVSLILPYTESDFRSPMMVIMSKSGPGIKVKEATLMKKMPLNLCR